MRFIFMMAAVWLALAASAKAQDYEKALEAYRAGDYAAALRLALPGAEKSQDYQDGLEAYETGDYRTALAEWRPMAEQGDAAAQFNLGWMYVTGTGVSQDYAEAVRWYRLAAERGSADAQYNLGLMYYRGDGVPQDYARAARWYRLAAEQGNANAQNNLGELYFTGRGVPQDDAQAVSWFRLAAERGNADAQRYLGLMYENGRGVTQDYAEAARWYRAAAEQGDSYAQFSLSGMYANGTGVPQDYAEAVRWLRLSSATSRLEKQYACITITRFAIDSTTVKNGGPSKLSIRTVPNEVLFISGVFSGGDASRIIQVLEQQNVSLVVLDSPGGVVKEAFSLADAIRERSIETYVPHGAECNSACFFPFMAGERRLADGDLSVHRPAAADADDTAPVNEVIRGMSDYILKAKELSVPDNILKYILESESLVKLTQYEKSQISTAKMRHVNQCNQMALARAVE